MSKSSSTLAARPTLPPESSGPAARRQVDDIADLIARSQHNRREARALLAEYGKNVSHRAQLLLLLRADCATVRKAAVNTVGDL